MTCFKCLSTIDTGHKKCPYCGRVFENTNPKGTLPAGTILIGRYTLDKVAAIDGEGVTYNAADAKLNRRVIIKEYVPFTICAQRTNEGVVIPRREKEVYYKTTRMDFMDLYRTLMSTDDSHGLCRVYDLFEANNTAYAVQEVPVGRTLEKFLDARKMPLTVQEAISLLRPIVYAVEAMHKRGLLHRGISPKTIFINSKGRAKLSGFATIGLRTSDSELKSQLYGGYSAPEQYSVAEFDGKYTDVYSLAAVFYRALTGITPPAANRRKQHDSIISPRNAIDTIPTFVSVALMRALRIKGSQRMTNAPELLAAITQPNVQSDYEKNIKVNSKKEKTNIYIVITLIVCFIVALALFAVLLFDVFGEEPEPTSTSQSTSQTSSVSQQEAEPEYITVPSLVNKSYTSVQQNEEYMHNFMFSVTETYNSNYDVGYILDQSPKSGQSVEVGSTIEIIVSLGPMTVSMPKVVGLPRTEAKAALDALGVDYMVLEHVNDGSYTPDTVVRSDFREGESIDPAVDTVTIFVAQQVP